MEQYVAPERVSSTRSTQWEWIFTKEFQYVIYRLVQCCMYGVFFSNKAYEMHCFLFEMFVRAKLVSLFYKQLVIKS